MFITNPRNEINDYGTILSDLTKPFTIRTQRYQFKHDNACRGDQTTVRQLNTRDINLPNIKLTDAESELRGITRKLSRMPQSRYKGHCQGGNDKNIPVCYNAPCINGSCEKKIVTGYYLYGPTKNYDSTKMSLAQV